MKYILAAIACLFVLQGNSQLLIPIKVGKLWGYCNEQKKIVIEPQFEGADPFDHAVAIVYKSVGDSSKMGLIDTTGRLIFPCEYDGIYTSLIGRTYLRKHNWTIVLEPGGNIFRPVKYQVVYGFTDSTYVAKHNGKCGVIDNKENIIVPFKYKELNGCDEKGWARAVDAKGRSGFINWKGKTMLRFRKDLRYSSFNDDRAAFYKNNRCGFVDRTGKVVIEPVYQRENGFFEGFCGVSNGARYGYINKNGDTLLPIIYGYAGHFRNGYGNFSIHAECGLIDSTGKEILRVNGDNLYYFNDSFINITRTTNPPGHGMGTMKYGVIDIRGKEVLPCIYRMIGLPENGIFWVSEETRNYYMDLKLNKYVLE